MRSQINKLDLAYHDVIKLLDKQGKISYLQALNIGIARKLSVYQRRIYLNKVYEIFKNKVDNYPAKMV
jgi:hypothetical protein